MLGFLIFQQVYLNLEEESRNKILGNIFDVDCVSVSEFFIIRSKVIFRLFSKGVFYQYCFEFDYEKDTFFLSNKVIGGQVSFSDKEINYPFIDWLIQSQDEYQVYQLLKRLL